MVPRDAMLVVTDDILRVRSVPSRVALVEVRFVMVNPSLSSPSILLPYYFPLRSDLFTRLPSLDD